MNIRTNRVKILLSINIIIFSLCALSCIRRIENDQLVENDQPSENNVVIKDDTLKGKSPESKFLELKELHNNLNEPLIAWVTPETQSAEIEDVLQQHFETPGPFYGMLLDLNTANTVPCPDRLFCLKSVSKQA